MADEIDLTQINENYPIAGVTQSTQGFRDNFKALKDNFATTKTQLSTIAVTLGGLDARILQVEQVTVNLEDQIAESLVMTELQSTVTTNYQTLDSRITSVLNTLTTADEALSTRIDTLSSSTSSGTLALINNESTTRANADSALSTQITNLSATVGQNTSAINNEITARTTADSALASSINSLEARTYPNPNLVYNPTFVRGLQGWTLYSNTAGTWTVVNNSAWGDHAEFKTSLTAGNYVGYQSDLFKAVAGQAYTAALDISALGVSAGQVSFQIQWLNASNSVISTTAATSADNGQGWKRYSQTATAPALATQARVRFFIQGATNTEAMVRRVKVETGTRATGFSDETTMGMTITSLQALISNETTARTSQNDALATQISNLTTTVTTNNNTLTSTINSESTSRTNADTALGLRIDSLTTTVQGNYSTLNSAIQNETTSRTNAISTLANQVNSLSSTVVSNHNLLFNPTFSRGLEGWTSYKNEGGDWTAVVAGIDGDVAVYSGNLTAGKYNGLESQKFKVLGSRKYVVALDTNTLGMSAGTLQYQFVWYGAAQNLLSSSAWQPVPAAQDWTRSNLKVTSPANAAFASFRYRLGDGTAAVTNTSVSLRRIKVEQGETPTVFSDDSTFIPTILSTQSLITQEATTRADQDSTLANLITDLTSTVNTNQSDINARITDEVATLATADGALSTRINNLTTTVNNNNTSLGTQISNETTARTNALTTMGERIDSLTTTVTNQGTTLGTQISNETTARTNALSTMGQRVDGIETRVASNEGSLSSVTSRVNTLEQASSTSAEAVALRTTNLEAQVRALGANRPHPIASWDFTASGAATGWTGNNATAAWQTGGGVLVTATAGDPAFISPTLADDSRIQGSLYPIVVIEVQNTGTVTLNEHTLFYTTGGHGISGSYYAIPVGGAPGIAPGARQSLVFDMRALSAGGSDWTSNFITGLRYDASNLSTASYKVWRVQVLGYDGGALDREIRAAIKTESQTRANETGALATQIQNISTNLTTNPNLIYNSTFALGLEGWTSRTIGGSPATPWVPTLESHQGPFVTATTVTGSGGKEHIYHSNETTIAAGVEYTAALDARALTLTSGSFYAAIEWLNSSGSIVSTSTIVTFSANQGWTRHKLTATSPTGSTKARISLWVANTTSNPNVGVKRIKFELGNLSTTWSDETTTGQGQRSLGTQISNEVTARTNGDTTLGGRIDTLTSTVNNNKTSIEARVQTEEQTRANETAALGSRATTLEARIVSRNNLIFNPTAADDLKGWTNSGTGTWTSAEDSNIGTYFSRTFNNASGLSSTLLSGYLTISPSTEYTLSGNALLAGMTAGSASIHVYFYNSSNGFIIDASRTIANNHNGPFDKLTFTTPSNAVKAKVYMRLTSVTGAAAAQFSLWRLKLETGSVASPFTDDRGNRDITARMNTADFAIADMQTNKASVSSVTSLNTKVDDNRSDFDDFVELTSGETSNLAIRATNLETEISNARNGGATLSARLGTIEKSVTDINGSALASRLDTLEAQISGTQDSNLRARLQTVELATTDGRFATASRASTLEAQMAGTQASNLNSRLQTVETATTDGRFASASRASALEARLNRGVTDGNQDFTDGLAGWSGSVTGAPWTDSPATAPIHNGVYQGRSNVITSRTGVAGTLYSIRRYPVLPGRTYRVRTAVYIGAGGASRVYVGVRTDNAAGVAVGGNGGHVYNAIGGDVFPAGTGWVERVSPAFTTAINPGTAQVQLLAFLNYEGTAGVVTGIEGIWLEDITDSVDIDSAEARLNVVETATTDGRFAAASRVNTLEAQLAGTSSSGLRSRLEVVETATTDGRFATASRASTLEAQMAGTSSSGLRSRLETVETATTDGRFATASSVSTLSARLNSGGDVYASIQNANSAGVNAQGMANALSRLTLNANGQITGYQASAGATGSNFTILASTFKVVDPNNSSNIITPFEVSGGVVRMNTAYIRNLTADSLTISNLGQITGNLGTITGGNITGTNININNRFIVDTNGNVTISSGTSGARVEITSSQVRVYDANNVLRVRLGLW